MLLVTAGIWGVAFVAQSVGAQYLGPFSFNCIRFFIGGCVLLPVIAFFSGKKKKEAFTKGEVLEKMSKKDKMTLITGGICCGLALSSASMMQQFGIRYTTVGKAGFITALYIIIVPILGIILKKKVSVQVWISAGIAVVGLYMLCMNETLSISKGDIYVLICAFLFSVHILIIDYFSKRAEGVKISCIQFFTSSAICAVGMFLIEKPAFANIFAAYIPILYAGIMSCGIAYTLQILAQKEMDPTVASLILSLESVVSLLSGWLILGQALSVKELFGCALMFGAIILAQLPKRGANREMIEIK